MPQIPAGWEETTLQLCTLPVQEKISLTQVSEDNYISTENMLPNIWWVVISSGLPNINSITKFQKWDILFSNIRTYFRKLWYATFTGGVSNDVLVFRGNYSKIYSKFLFYRLSDNSFFDYTIKTSKWTKMPRWDKEAIWNFPIHLPPPPEQQAIAAVLSSFDDKIELLRAENQTLEQMGQELFKERFSKWKVGDELPEGWRVGKLSEIADFLNGLPLQKYPANEWEKSLPVIKIREMKSWITDQTGRASVDIDQKYIVQDWDVLFSRSGSLELVFWEYWPWALNQHLFKVTSSNYPKRFYYYWILYHLSEFRVIANTKATTMGHIQRGHLDLAKVTIPDSESLIAFDKVMSKIIQKLLDNKGQIQTLSATRDQLLPKLMSWEVRVEF